MDRASRASRAPRRGVAGRVAGQRGRGALRDEQLAGKRATELRSEWEPLPLESRWRESATLLAPRLPHLASLVRLLLLATRRRGSARPEPCGRPSRAAPRVGRGQQRKPGSRARVGAGERSRKEQGEGGRERGARAQECERTIAPGENVGRTVHVVPGRDGHGLGVLLWCVAGARPRGRRRGCRLSRCSMAQERASARAID